MQAIADAAALAGAQDLPVVGQGAAVTVSAEAQATAGLVTQAQGAVPLVVTKNQAQLTACNGIPASTSPRPSRSTTTRLSAADGPA